jgi:hypothetical protein
MVLANQTLTNKSSSAQEMKFELNKTETHTSTFEYGMGLTISMGTTIKGINLLSSYKTYLIEYLRWCSTCCRGRIQNGHVNESGMEVWRTELVHDQLCRLFPSEGRTWEDRSRCVDSQQRRARGPVHNLHELEEHWYKGRNEGQVARCVYLGSSPHYL